MQASYVIVLVNPNVYPSKLSPLQVTQIATGYGFTVAAIKTDEQHKVFGTGINTDSQIGYHAPRMGHPLELLLSPAPIYIPYKSLDTKVGF